MGILDRDILLELHREGHELAMRYAAGRAEPEPVVPLAMQPWRPLAVVRAIPALRREVEPLSWWRRAMRWVGW